MTYTAIRGHALRSEGKPYVPGDEEAWVRRQYAAERGVAWRGHALCECGEVSSELDSDYARKNWHAQHKAEISSASIPNRQTEE